jgi:hypothetical protein
MERLVNWLLPRKDNSHKLYLFLGAYKSTRKKDTYTPYFILFENFNFVINVIYIFILLFFILY